MTLHLSPSRLLPPAEASTSNGDSSGSAAASFDLLCLPGIVMCFLDDSTVTQSSGAGSSARQLCQFESGRAGHPGFLSSGTTDSSALGVPGGEEAEPGGCASQFLVPMRKAVAMDLGALISLLENLMLLLADDDQPAAAGVQHSLGSEGE